MADHAAACGLLLLPGWGFGPGVWQPVIDQLGAEVKVSAISLPGYADPDPVPAMDAVIEQLAATAAGASTMVVGWSLGGLLAIELAWRYPDRVRALGLIAALPCFKRQPGWAAGWEQHAVAAVYARLQQDAAAACRYVAALAARGDNKSQTVKQALGSCAVPKRGVLERDLQHLMNADCREAFAGLALPIHVWLGDRDALIGGDCAAALRALQPAADIHELEQAGHAPLLSRPEKIANDLLTIRDRYREQ